MLKKLFVLLLIVAAPTILGLAVWYAFGLCSQMELDAIRESYESTAMNWLSLLGFVLADAFAIRKHYVPFSLGGIARQKLWPMIGITLVITAAIVAFHWPWYILTGIESLFPSLAGIPDGTIGIPESRFSGMAGILEGVIAIPIFEEIVFRGILLGGLLRMRCRPWLAILISALVFSILHHPVAFVPALLMALVAGWLYWRTGSLIPGIIIHVVNNSLSFLELAPGKVACVIILLASLLLLALGIWWFEKNTPRLSQEVWRE